MKPTLHILTIENRRTDDTVIHGFDYPALRAKVAAYCLDEWPDLMPGEPVPDDDDELITDYFDDHDKEYLIEQSFELDLPQPYASGPHLLDTLREMVIANHGMPADPTEEPDRVRRAALTLALLAIHSAEESERSDTSPPAWNPESHWDHYPEHPTEDWTDAVISGGTRLGYVAWVNVQLTDS